KDTRSNLGGGRQLVVYGASMISRKGVRDSVVETAKSKDMPYQYATMAGGGTDSGSIHLTANGVPSMSSTVATRYIHSHAAILHRNEFEIAVILIVEVIHKLNNEKMADNRLA